MSTGTPIQLSIVIVNYNVRHFLEQCLLSVATAIEGISAEVFVVDNCSVDGSVEMLRERFPWVILMANADNVGFSRANNQALAVAQGKYHLLLNPDTVVEADTFVKCITFMDAHPEAGGLGVKMVDGKGKFLPESKRSLPTPEVAFYKIFGLSWLFPQSKQFGRYHLTYLNKDETHPVEVLSGAYMLMRKTVLDQIGLLDEDFFMYGEDVDLSYRILKGGYANYYFPEARIIHYKGESTKKGSLNYVFVFYNAMAIFARKHFSKERARLFSVLINVAILLRATVAIVHRTAQKLALPVADGISLFTGLTALALIWEIRVKAGLGVHYPIEYYAYVLPAYSLLWVMSIMLAGGYDLPLRASRLWRGLAAGSVLLLVVYALMGENIRFSRAVVLLGTVWAAFYIYTSRWALHFFGLREFDLRPGRGRRFLIIGSGSELNRVDELLRDSVPDAGFIGHASSSNEVGHGLEANVLGTADRLNEMIRVHRVNEVVFCAKDLPAQRIIDLMTTSTHLGIDFKIAPPQAMFLVGSNSIDSASALYVVGAESVASPSSRRMKRVFDLLIAVGLLLSLPITIWLVAQPLGLLRNCFSVLMGTRTWVGYAQSAPSLQASMLPPLRPSVLHPLVGNTSTNTNPDLFNRVNMLYAKGFSVRFDLKVILRGIGQLGQ